MSKSALSIALLSLCSPAAFAFPPCPADDEELIPIDDPTYSRKEGVPPWFVAGYVLEGNPEVLNAIRPMRQDAGNIISTGKCRPSDVLPIPGSHIADESLNVTPHRAPASGYGMIFLPDIRSTDPGRLLRYTLGFIVDGRPLDEANDWFDVAELELQWTLPLSTARPHDISTLYRVRKDRSSDGRTIVRVIESRRMQPSGPGYASRIDESVVATIPVDPAADGMPVKLQWSQRTRIGTGGDSIPDPEVIETQGSAGYETTTHRAKTQASAAVMPLPMVPPTVDTWFEVVGPNGQSLYRRELRDQWVSVLSMGVLDYTASSVESDSQAGPILESMELNAELQ